jgi:hypothetical protein
MMFSRSFAVHAGFAPFWRIQAWALEHAASVHSPSGDLRLAIAALALSAFGALEALVQKQLMLLARNTMGSALRGARFAGGNTAADTMVAAGGG